MKLSFAKQEPTQIHDAATSKPVAVTTTARKYYRAANPAWEHIKNEFLSIEIANQFAKAPELGTFKPKKNPENVGHIRGTESSKFIAIETNNEIVVIAVKGTHSLSAPKKASRDDALRNHRGWLENHYFDIFIGQYNLDQKSVDILKKHVANKGVLLDRKMKQDEVSQLAMTLMGEDQRGQITRDPGISTTQLGLLNLPVGFPV